MKNLPEHTVETSIVVGGARLEVTDEATLIDQWGTPRGWILFIDVQGEQMTSSELREVADAMDKAARISGRDGRHDV